jgi:hypothetical protein
METSRRFYFAREGWKDGRVIGAAECKNRRVDPACGTAAQTSVGGGGWKLRRRALQNPPTLRLRPLPKAPPQPKHSPQVGGAVFDRGRVGNELRERRRHRASFGWNWPLASGFRRLAGNSFSRSERDHGGVTAWSCHAARGDAGGPPASTGGPPVPPMTQACGETFPRFRAKKMWVMLRPQPRTTRTQAPIRILLLPHPRPEILGHFLVPRHPELGLHPHPAAIGHLELDFQAAGTGEFLDYGPRGLQVGLGGALVVET